MVAFVAELPTLLVNQSRHSLESYFCDPDQLEAVLVAHDAAAGPPTFAPRTGRTCGSRWKL